MSNNPNRYYQESGRVNNWSVIAVVIIVLAVTLGIGYVYGFISYYYPYPVYSVLMVIAYAAIVGYSMSLGVKWFKLRNQKFTSRLSQVLGIAAVYIAWVWFMTVDQDRLVWSPIDIIRSTMSHDDLWWGAYVAWVLEIVIIQVVMWFSVTADHVDPFCESCNKWIKPNPQVKNLEPFDKGTLIYELENHKYDYLKSLRKINETAHDQTRVKLYSCKNCRKSNFLSVEQVFVVVNKKGKPEEDTCHSQVANLIVNPQDMSMLKEWAKNR